MKRPTASIILAELIQLKENNTEISAHRVFDSLTANDFPVTAQFWVLGKVWGLALSEQAEARYQVVQVENGNRIAESPPHQWHSQGPDHLHTALHLFEAIQFPDEGIYHVQMVVDGEVVAFFPLRLQRAFPRGNSAH